MELLESMLAHELLLDRAPRGAFARMVRSGNLLEKSVFLKRHVRVL